MEKQEKPRRLCTEIQLFDLCDKEVCTYKDGRFCTSDDILARFEAIQEQDDRLPLEGMGDESDDAEADEIEDDDLYDMDGFDEEEPEEDW